MSHRGRMLEVVRVRLGSAADAKLGEARSRFEDVLGGGDDDVRAADAASETGCAGSFACPKSAGAQSASAKRQLRNGNIRFDRREHNHNNDV